MSIPTAIDVLRAYENWEADLILSDEAWGGEMPGGVRTYPLLTEELWERLLTIQDMRNRALASHGPKQAERT